MRVAIIGTRTVTKDMPLYEMLAEWSRILLEKGVIVRTGAADGIDSAAMEGAERVQNTDLRRNLHVFLPWASYNRNRVPIGASVFIYDPKIHQAWTNSVSKYHPNPAALSRGAFALMARNYGIIAHPDPVSAVIALPTSVSALGGTGQGMRLAEDLGIKLFNLREDNGVNDAACWIDEL